MPLYFALPGYIPEFAFLDLRSLMPRIIPPKAITRIIRNFTRYHAKAPPATTINNTNKIAKTIITFFIFPSYSMTKCTTFSSLALSIYSFFVTATLIPSSFNLGVSSIINLLKLFTSSIFLKFILTPEN